MNETVPERDDVTEEILQAALAVKAKFIFGRIQFIKAGKGSEIPFELSSETEAVAIILAVAPLIRAEGYRQGVEDAAKIAEYRIERLKSGEKRCVSDLHIAMNMAQQEEAQIIVDGIRALINQPGASDKSTET